jgi:hypothetical protein
MENTPLQQVALEMQEYLRDNYGCEPNEASLRSGDFHTVLVESNSKCTVTMCFNQSSTYVMVDIEGDAAIHAVREYSSVAHDLERDEYTICHSTGQTPAFTCLLVHGSLNFEVDGTNIEHMLGVFDCCFE